MENKELSQLKTVYDELWSDAKTMIKDMNRSITMVFLFGLTMIAIFMHACSHSRAMNSRSPDQYRSFTSLFPSNHVLSSICSDCSNLVGTN